MNVITYDVYKNTVKKHDGFNPVTSEKNYTKLQFRFQKGDDWEKCTLVTASFWLSNDNIVKSDVELLSDNLTATFDIPPEFSGVKGDLKVGLQGTCGEDVIIATNIITLNRNNGVIVTEGANTELYQKIIDLVNKYFNDDKAQIDSFISEVNVTLSEFYSALSAKADKATTLAGFGITDGENICNKKSVIDFQNPSETDYPNITALYDYHNSYVKPCYDEIDNLEENKADKATTLAKTELYKNTDNLISFKNGIYTIRGVVVTVENDTITIKGTATEGTLVLSIPFESNAILSQDKYVFSMLNIVNKTANRPTIWLVKPYQSGVSTTELRICRVCEYKLQLNNTTGVTASVLIDKTNDTESTTASRIQFAPVAGKKYDVSFNLSLVKGEGRTQYINKQSPYNVLDLYNSLGIMNPAAYGVVGDGITDDTASLQAMIDDACKMRKKIELGKGKTYLISDTLRFNNPWLDFDGNGATIVVSDKIGNALIFEGNDNPNGEDKAQLLYAIYIHTGKDCNDNTIYQLDDRLDENGSGSWGKNNYKSRMFGNVTIDCNCGTARYGIYIDQGVKLKIHDIAINDAELIGLYTGVSNWENIIENVHCNRCRLSHKTKKNSIGFSINSSDTYINNCISIDYDIGFMNFSGDNHFSHCHAWNNFAADTEDSRVKSDAESRVGFANNGAYATYVQCTVDACGIGWSIGDDTIKTMLLGCVSAYPKAIRQIADTVTLIKFGSANTLKGKSVVICASNLKPGKIEADDTLQNYNFDNLSDSDSPIIIDSMVDSWTVAHTTLDKSSQNGADGRGITNTEINANGELVLTYSDGSTANVGAVVGAKGEKGDKGDTGATGADGNNYVLTDTDKAEIANIAIDNIADGDEVKY